MALPNGARWTYGENRRKTGAILSDGSRVSRAEAERLGARESGYKNPHRERTDKASRKGFVTGNSRYTDFVKRARAHAKATGGKVDPRKLEAAYWRLHVAGKTFRAAKGTRHQAEAQVSLQDAMRAASGLTGRSAQSFPRSGDTP